MRLSSILEARPELNLLIEGRGMRLFREATPRSDPILLLLLVIIHFSLVACSAIAMSNADAPMLV